MLEDVVLFVQRRCGKTGAPVALSRLLGHAALRPLRPMLLTSTDGWLTEECRRLSVPVLRVPFPNSRSVWGLLWGNKVFALRVRRLLRQRGLTARAVTGNDHLEGLLTLALGKACAAPTMIYLRSSEMTQRDYLKYGCNRCDRIFAAGDIVFDHLNEWVPGNPAKLLYDGLNGSEFLPPKPKAPRFPTRWLVVGSEKHDKGWQDFAASMDLLERDAAFPALELHFTGRAPDSPLTDMHLSTPRRSRFHFIGRQENFLQFIRGYDLVVHPSREETFGLAMVETLAAGVPMISSRAGVVGKIQMNPELLFNPMDPEDQARSYRHLWQHWEQIDFRLAACQERIRRLFLLDGIAAELADEIRLLRPIASSGRGLRESV